MELEFLGTGAGTPGKFRNVTSVALKLLDETNDVWLFDCGEATQHQILRTNLRPRKIDKIFITHLHGDHIFGLPGFLSSRSFQGGDGKLTIYGPRGIKDFVLTSLKISDTRLGYKIDFHELDGDGEILNNDKFIVRAEKLDHRILSFGYRIEEKAHQGELQVEKLKEMNIPSGPVYGRLKRGETVTLQDGRTVNGKDFVGKPQAGRIITILGDTRRVDSIESLAKDADVLVHESTFGKNEGKLARNYYHSTNMQAASVAKKVHVKELLLTHISARYTAKMSKELERDAKQVFANTRVVKDFDVINIPMEK